MRQKYHWHYLQKDTICSAEDFYQVVLKNRNWDLETYKAVFSWDKITPSSLGIDESQLQKAMTRLEKARDSGEQVLIFGDYDVDGNCATAIMWQGLQAFGIHATPFIPNRFTHGYGMSIKALQEIIATQKPDLIITVDNGITAHPALEFCHQQQIDVIVTDHHQPEKDKTLPVVATVHTQKLCGAGVAWYLIYRLLAQAQDLEQAQKVSTENLDLVALATIVDQVPLTNINRTLVKKGITQLQKKLSSWYYCFVSSCQTPARKN